MHNGGLRGPGQTHPQPAPTAQAGKGRRCKATAPLGLKGLTAVYEVYSGRFWRVGGSRGIVLNRDIWQRLGLVPGDLMLITVFGPLMIMRRVKKADVCDIDTIPAAALPPVNQSGEPRI